MKWMSIIYLGCNTWTDWKRKEINLTYTIFFILSVAFINLWVGIPQNWAGLLPGVFLWLLSRWKKEKIGNGDGPVVMGLGWAIGLEKIWKVLTGGFLLAGCAGIVFLAAGKKKTVEIPFVPFVCISFLLEEWMK